VGVQIPAPQEAPGGSRGTPGRTRARVPCMWARINESPQSPPAWMAGWVSCPVSPGFHPGLLGPLVTPTRSPRRKPGDTGSNTSPRAMHVGVTRAMHVGVTQRSCRRFEHGWRGGFHSRCPRVSTRGFLDAHKKPPAEAGEAPVRIGGAAREPGRLETIQASIGKPAPLGRPTVTVPAARPTSRLHAPEGQP
jgi:hypothetical protein